MKSKQGLADAGHEARNVQIFVDVRHWSTRGTVPTASFVDLYKPKDNYKNILRVEITSPHNNSSRIPSSSTHDSTRTM